MPGLFGHQPRDRVSEDRRFFDERYQRHLDRLNRPWLENPRPRMSDRRAHDLAREARIRETRAREALGGEDRDREALRRERHTPSRAFIPSRAFNALSNPLPSLPDYQPDFRLAVPFQSRTSYAQSGSAAQAEFRTRDNQARSRDALRRREARIIPASSRAARVYNLMPSLSEIQRERERESRLRSLAPALETREREAHRRDTRTYHISIPTAELASQNQTMNLSSQQTRPAGHFRVSVPRAREAFRRDTNAPDVDQFNTILSQLAERDLQNV